MQEGGISLGAANTNGTLRWQRQQAGKKNIYHTNGCGDKAQKKIRTGSWQAERSIASSVNTPLNGCPEDRFSDGAVQAPGEEVLARDTCLAQASPAGRAATHLCSRI